MGLETGTLFSDLVTTNPLGSDSRTEGDDHIRLLKTVLKTTFSDTSTTFTITKGTDTYVSGSTGAVQNNTWNNAGTTFTAFGVNITNTASTTGSKVLDYKIGGQSVVEHTTAQNGTFTIRAQPPHGQALSITPRNDSNGSLTFTSGGGFYFDSALNIGAGSAVSNTVNLASQGSGSLRSLKVGSGLLNLPPITTPPSPTNGDMWTETGGVYARVNGATVGPFAASAGGSYLPIGGGTLTGPLTVQGSITSSQDFLSSTTTAQLATTGAGTIKLRPNGTGSTVGEMTVASDGQVTMYSHLTGYGIYSNTGYYTSLITTMTLGPSSAGTILLRPTSPGSSTGQVSLANTGVMTVSGSIALPATGTQSATSLNFGTAGTGVYGTSAAINASISGTRKLALDATAITAFVKLWGVTSTTATAGLNLPHGVAPTTPTDGDMWTTTAGMYARINGATVGPFGAGGTADWSTITGKPATFPPTVPIAQADITNLTTDLTARVLKAGDNMSGNLSIQAATPTYLLQKTASGQAARIAGYLNATARWFLAVGDSQPESGSNTGSDFSLTRYTDAGAQIDSPFTITRSTGVANFSVAPTVAGVAIPSAGPNFVGTTSTTYLATTGAGTIGLRPSGVGSTTGQMTVSTFGDVTASGAIKAAQDFTSTSTTIQLATSGSPGQVVLRPNGTGSSTGQMIVGQFGDMTVSGTVTAAQNFISSTALAYFGPTGAGTIGLRPNGVGSTTGETMVASTGDMTVKGAITATGAVLPSVNNGASVGSNSQRWSNIYLATGGNVNFGTSNDIQLYHQPDVLEVVGGDLRVGTPGTNAASVATLNGTQTLVSKTLDSPTLTGTPIAPTATAGTSTTQIATTAYVDTAVGGIATGAAISDTAPSHAQGKFWWNSSNGNLYISYNDGTSTQWVQINGVGS